MHTAEDFRKILQEITRYKPQGRTDSYNTSSEMKKRLAVITYG